MTIVRWGLLLLSSAAYGSLADIPLDIFPSDQIPGTGPQGPEVCGPGFANSTVCTSVSIPTLIPFLVPGSDNGAVVIAPGGGFHALAYSTEGTEVAHWLNGLGLSAFVLKYRVPAQFGYHELPMMDAQRAVRFVRFHHSKLGLNASRIGIMGFSAGGDLSAGMSANFAIPQYGRIDSIDDQICRPDFSLMVYPAVHNWSNNITIEHPPAFFAQADHDPVNSDLTIEYFARVKKISKAVTDLHIFHGDIHGYGLCTTRDAQGRIPVLVAGDGPGLVPAWRPWSDVCLWPSMAHAFLKDLELVSTTPQLVII